MNRDGVVANKQGAGDRFRPLLGSRLIASPLALAVVVFFLALGPRVLDLAVFVGPDEFSWVTRSANFARALVSGNLAQTYQSGHPGITLLWIETLGAWLRYGFQALSGTASWEAIIGPYKTITFLGDERTVAAIANTILLTLAVLLIRAIFDYRTAWLAAFLLAFNPFLLTESRALRSEGVFTGFSLLAVLGLVLYAQTRRLRYSLLCGVLTGLALLSKASAVALLPVGALVMAGMLFLNSSSHSSRPWRATTLALLLWGCAAILTVFILWPALWVTPGEVFRQMFGYVGARAVEGVSGGKSFILGEDTPNEDLGLTFYPLVLLYRTSPLLWLGLIALVAVMVWRGRYLSRQYKISLGIMLLYLAIYLALISGSSLKYDRYALSLLAVLDVMAAVGLVSAWQWLGERGSSLKPYGWLVALSILVGQMALALPHHPYYYTYWNPLLGGLKQAVRILPVGTGAEGVDQVVAYLNTLPNADKLNLASAVSQKVRPLFKGEAIPMDNVDGRWVQADYVMIYISQAQRGKHSDDILTYLARHNPIYTLVLQGMEYAWVYPGPAAQYYGGGQKLEGRGALFGYNLGKTDLAAGDTLPVTLFWRNEGQQPTDRFFVRLMDLDGYVWAEAIAQPRPGFEAASQQENSMVESEAALTLPIGMPPGDYFFKPGFRTVKGELIGYFELPGDTKPLYVTTAKTYPPKSSFQPTQSTHLVANDELTLLGYELAAKENSANAQWVTLYWQALTDVTHDYVISLRLLNEDRQEVAYWLGRPVRSGYPTLEWKARQIVQDPWLLTLPPEAERGRYRLEIAVFDAESKQEIGRQIIGQIDY